MNDAARIAQALTPAQREFLENLIALEDARLIANAEIYIHGEFHDLPDLTTDLGRAVAAELKGEG